MRTSTFSAGLYAALAAVAAARSTIERRSTTSLGKLYAYGTNISGLVVYYDDFAPHIGNTSTISSSSFADLNFTLSNGALTAVEHNVASNSSSISNSTSLTLFVDSTSGSITPASFNASSGYTSTGFLLYGSAIARTNVKGMLETNFVATPTDNEGVYALAYNSGALLTDETEAINIMLKTTPPAAF